ncbi:hypothetical protein GGX14DRAFT_663346 [Mycena pura]|uniref:RlpA-like protein double-psi beta-barrel domain-containing protein n=1 Tax=Mycena pura TaxID=153505 RepID=A0AAD7E027_9AGAR|nr:hypothetical protein GGX14DRAFT_663346 [Mycena pura]
MLFQLPVSALLLAFAVLSEASSHGRGAHLAHMRRRALNPRGPQPLADAPMRLLSRRSSCRKKSSSSTTLPSSTKLVTVANVAPAPSTTTRQEAPPATATSTEKAAPAPTTKDSSSPTSGAAAGFKPVKPSDWPTATQAGTKPTSTVASAHDPYLEELSNAIDYTSYGVFTEVHTGDMTYYGQGLGACGDVYDDESFTAAVSHDMFDNWPNPICGPFVPGRQHIDTAGLMVTAVKSSISGYAQIGGDGLINCVGSPQERCHVPLTATVTHGDKSIQVQIVDRCAGCEPGDIDLTPAAFAALADMSLGRTSATWKFNPW